MKRGHACERSQFWKPKSLFVYNCKCVAGGVEGVKVSGKEWASPGRLTCKRLDVRVGETGPPLRQPRGKWMIYLVNSHTNATSKRWHLWGIDLRFARNSTPGQR